MLQVKHLDYASWQTVYFQRTTVIVTELVLVYALHLYLYSTIPISSCILIVSQLREDIQVKGHCTCCCAFRTAVTRPADH